MEVNAGVEGKNTCECGRAWLLSKRKEPQRDKDDISCPCGRTLVSWNGGCVWTAKLIKGLTVDGFKCDPCELKIEKNDDQKYSFAKPGLAVPIKLTDGNLLREAYKTGICPLCGFEMTKL